MNRTDTDVPLRAQLLLAVVLTLVIKGAVALFHHWIAWWAAAALALVAVFGGFAIFDDDNDWFR
jgi:hypothetical protein